MGKIFSGTRKKWLPLYDELKNAAHAALGDFEELEKTNAVYWRHSSAFAEVMARKNGLVVAFPAAKPHAEWNPARITRTSLNRYMHHFEATDRSRFPWLMERMAEAYSLTKSSRTGKNPLLKRLAAQDQGRRPAAEKAATIDEYIAGFPRDVREKLSGIRKAIRKAAPGALEKISYQMPAFWHGETLIYFAAFKDHLSIFPGADATAAFRYELADYAPSGGALRIPLDKPVPYKLIEEMAAYRLNQAIQNKQQRRRNRLKRPG